MDKQKEVASRATFDCLVCRLNKMAEEGDLTTPFSDKERPGLVPENHTTFCVVSPKFSDRYRRNVFHNQNGGYVAVWHPDPDGDWVFCSNDEFSHVEKPDIGHWGRYDSSRGEFRMYKGVLEALGESELLLKEAMQ